MKNKGLILLLFLTLTGRLVADNTAELSSLALKNMMTAQVSDFQKNGNVPVSLHTGALNLSIPLYTIKDLDFNFPISLGYNSEGFKPRKHSGYVGLNWFLNAGGCVTREVRGYVADDCIGVEGGTELGQAQDGFLINARNNPPFNKDSVFNFSTSVGQFTPNGGFVLHYYPDYMPDVFHFNFCGYSGVFMLGNDGKPVIMNGDFVEVDLERVHGATNIKLTNPEPEDDSEITIKTLDGYTYKFGGDLSALEYSIQVFCDQRNGNQMDNGGMEQKRPAINTWHLKKIVAPNGRVLEFHYKPFNIFLDKRDDNLWVFNEYYEQNEQPQQQMTYIARSATKEAILDSITISDGGLAVVFQNSVSEKSLYYGKGDFCNKNYQLDSLQVIVNGELLKTYRLNYEYKADNFSINNGQRGRRFLTQVVMNDRGIYSMKYNHPLTYTYLDIPTANEYQKIDYFGYTKERFDLGLISEIKYPTGGKSVFRFEPHDYSIRKFYAYKYQPVDQTSTSSGDYDWKDTTLTVMDSQPDQPLRTKSLLDNVSQTLLDSLSAMFIGEKKYLFSDLKYITDSVNDNNIGGARIASITSYNKQDELVEQKNYSYQLEGDSKSSGVYYDKTVRFGSISLNAHSINSYDLIEYPIGYSTVVEEQILYPSQNKWYTIYNFSGKFNLDLFDDCRVSKLDFTTSEIIEICAKGYLSYPARSVKAGDLTSTIIREGSPTGSIKQEHTYIRRGLLVKKGDKLPYIVLLADSYTCDLVRKIFPINSLLDKEEIIDYMSDGSQVSQTTWYDYDSSKRVTKKTNESSINTKKIFERYRYADDVLKDVDLSMTHEGESPLLTSNIAGYFSLNKNRMIGSPVETISGYFQNGQEYVTGGTLHLYGTSGQNILLSKPVLSRSLSLSLSAPLEDFDSVRIENNRLVYSSLYVPTADYTFNSKLRLTSIQPYGLLKTSYIWDPNNLYPTSQTTGDQTVTYNYKPFVGMQSQTDARGITTYYSYDAFGRLVEVYQLNGGKKEILNAYSYNYAH